MIIYQVMQKTHRVLKQCYSIILCPNFIKIHKAIPSYLLLTSTVPKMCILCENDDQKHISVVNSEFLCFLARKGEKVIVSKALCDV